MKTNQIAEKAKVREKAIEYSTEQLTKIDFSYVKEMATSYVQAALIDGYEHGHESCNSEWQEKLRWIPVTEKLPEENKKYLVKDLYGCIHTASFNIHSNKWSFFGYDADIVGWREIIE